MGKLYDIAAKVGTYQKNGEDKALWQNVGVVLETKSGGQVILLDRTFSPAGLPDDGSGRVMLSMFEPREEKSDGAPKKADKPAKRMDIDDGEIPF